MNFLNWKKTSFRILKSWKQNKTKKTGLRILNPRIKDPRILVTVNHIIAIYRQ